MLYVHLTAVTAVVRLFSKSVATTKMAETRKVHSQNFGYPAYQSTKALVLTDALSHTARKLCHLARGDHTEIPRHPSHALGGGAHELALRALVPPRALLAHNR